MGYGLAPIFQWEPEKRRRFLYLLGGSLLLAFVALRTFNLYGEPEPWQLAESPIGSFLSFLSLSKYPPSLLYLCATLGLALPIMALAERYRPPLYAAFVTIGRVPLFYYVVHLYLAHLLALVVAILQGMPATAWLANPFFNRPENFGFSLPVVYLFWLGVVLALYPACRWFAHVKATSHRWWLSYL